jgi:hypothetical protein
MPKTARAAPPEAQPSTARGDLDRLRRELDAAETRAAAAARPVARLETELAAIAVRHAEAAEAGRAYALAMAEWATTGQGAAPEPPAIAEPKGAEREATETALAIARRGLEAAEADRALAQSRIAPAVAGVLREDGARLAADYWRRWGEIERIRRELAALDQVLAADFPIIHGPTGRTILEFVSPEKLSAPAAMRAIEAATAGLPGLPDLIRAWRDAAAALVG